MAQSYVTDGALSGIVQMGDYATPVGADDKVQELISLIFDPNSLRSSGRDVGSLLDKMTFPADVQLYLELNARKDELADYNPVDEPTVNVDSHVVTAGEVTATIVTIDTGLATVDPFSSLAVTIYRASVGVTLDAVITDNEDGSFSVEDGAVTYNLTAGDVINWGAAI